MTEPILPDDVAEPSADSLPASTPLPLAAAPEPTQPEPVARPVWQAPAFWLGLGFDIILIALICIGVYFRFEWTNWSQGTDLHPDEYGLTGDLTIMSIPTTISDYFNTRLSSISPYDKYDLNGVKTADGPNNRFPYGQLPLLIIRLTAEGLNQIDPLKAVWCSQTAGDLTYCSVTDYVHIRLLGRQLSALMDTLALLVIYLIGQRLYGHRVGLIAAALAALAPMEIQQSHFMTADNFSTFFTALAMYGAVRVATPSPISDFRKWGRAGEGVWYAFFGMAFGMAVACRVNLLPLAAEIVVAAVIANHQSLFSEKSDAKFTRALAKVTGLLVVAGVAALLTFRLLQPMSFRAASGDTSLLTVTPNPDWTLSIQIASAQNNGEGAGPPGEQWTNRPAIVFPFVNMVLWGMGLPMGIAAWAGLLWALRQVIQKTNWQAHLLPLTWAGGYFVFIGTRWVKSVRYFLPIYPFMALFAAWILVELWKSKDTFAWAGLRPALTKRIIASASAVVGVIVLAGSLIWAYGFTGIYRTDNTRIQASRWIYQNIPAPLNIRLTTADGDYSEPIPFSSNSQVTADLPIPVPFSPRESGTVTQLLVGYARNTFGAQQLLTLDATLALDPNGQQPLARTQVDIHPSQTDFRGGTGVAQFGPVPVTAGETYYLILTASQGGPISLSGATLANENWDEGLPLRLDGRDGFGGLYTGQTMEVRWNDDENKRLMFATVLSQTDYIILPSQRGLWSVSRLPATYPMTIEYYRALFDGRLGFDLVASFQSPIILGPLQISDVGGTWAWNQTPKLPLFNDSQLAAEEAFSVYDHAPVWIFKKRADFDFGQAMAVLNAVDLNTVVVMGPREATAAPTLLMLPDDRLAEQRAGGTWADMFNPEMVLNKYESLGVVVWWLTCVLLGWLAFPIAFVALPGLPDRGYALSRNLALLLIAWSAWFLASFEVVPFSQLTLWAMAGVMALVSGFIVWRRHTELIAWVKQNGRYMVAVELLAVLLFAFFLLVRLGNGDLWHQAKGGEKPMDFSYFNAVIKSTSFPPYDPWFSGGYLNYYYFGFVVVATLTKMLAIVPAFAYNLILPMLFSLAGMGAFCVAYNLVAGGQRLASGTLPTKLSLQRLVANPYMAGIAAAGLFVVLGNLGQWNLILSAFKRAANDIQPILPISFVADWQRIAIGFWRIYVQHFPVLVGTDEWYWNATRVIPDSGTMPITEFPYFTFLYADLHAHMIVLTITTLALGWALSTVLAATDKTWRWIESIAVWVIAGIVFGSIQPANLSDYQTYWALGCVAIAYGQLRRRPEIDLEFVKQVAWRCALFVGLSLAFFWPYTHWRGEGYGSVELWKGDKTPIDAYLTIHGLFLFVIFAFLLTETRRWMQSTLLEDVQDLLGPAVFALVAFGLLVFGLWWLGYSVAVIALPLILWTGLLMIRPNGEPERRAALGLIGLGLLLTLVVEAIVAKGDIGRMNTVFKFYLQVWTMLSVAGGAAIAWVWAQMPEWKALSRGVWQIGLTILVTVAAMYTVLATSAKVQDRMAPAAPRTLDGMLYMAYATYADQGQTVDLKWDYDAIRWMQENVKGSPVIVEVNAPEYRWGSRFTINTGLPGVLGWNWHQRQQRVVVPDQLIWKRSNDINAFYLTDSTDYALEFLKRYDVSYVIAGEYEHLYFPSPLFEKFDKLVRMGKLAVAYRNEGTVIYEVVGSLAGN
jgi:YYY domain-containing protein